MRIYNISAFRSPPTEWLLQILFFSLQNYLFPARSMAVLKLLSLLLLIILSFSIVNSDFSKYPNVVCKSICPYFTSNPYYFSDEFSQAENLTDFLVVPNRTLPQVAKQFRFYTADFKQKHLHTLIGLKNLRGYWSEIYTKFGDSAFTGSKCECQNQTNLASNVRSYVDPDRQLLDSQSPIYDDIDAQRS